MEPEVRYCTTNDGMRIAYSVMGSGRPMIYMEALIGSFSYYLHLEFGPAIRQMAEGRTLVMYDGRGTGLSQRDVKDFSLDARLRDLTAVVRPHDCAGSCSMQTSGRHQSR